MKNKLKESLKVQLESTKAFTTESLKTLNAGATTYKNKPWKVNDIMLYAMVEDETGLRIISFTEDDISMVADEFVEIPNLLEVERVCPMLKPKSE